MKQTVLVFLTLAATACSVRQPSGDTPANPVPDNPGPTTADYLCGAVFVRATFAADSLLLDVAHRRHELVQARSASGARYTGADPAVEFWEHQGEAQLTIAGRTLPTCSPAMDADLAPFLTAREWVVEDIARGGIIDASRITMAFGADGTLSGLAGCNRYSGRYTLDRRTLTTSQLVSTRKACVPALMNQESAFLRILENAARAAPGDHGALVIESANGERLLAR